MGIVSSLLERRSSLENPITSLSNPAAWLTELFGGGKSHAGVPVNEQSALELAPVWAAVQILARPVSTVPLITYRRLDPRGKERAPAHPNYRLLHLQPNPWMTSVVFRETLMGHLLTWGNAYAEREYDGAGRLIGLWPLLPDRTRPVIRDGRKAFVTRVREGESEREVVLPADRVLHIPGFGFDGIVGYSPIRLAAKQAVGLAKATEEYGARFFGNGARPGGVMEHPANMSEEAQKRFKAGWQEIHGGLTNAHRVAILEEGMKYTQIGIPPEDSQFLETRRFQLAEFARIFGVPLHMLAEHTSGSSYASVENFSLEFVTYSVTPWLVRIEQQINVDLFDDDAYFAEHLLAGLLRGDMKSRSEALAVQRQNGVVNADEWREIENMNPLPDGVGEMYLVPLNMVPAHRVEEVVDAQVAGKAPSAAAPPEGDKRASWAERRARVEAAHAGLFRSLARSTLESEANALRRAMRKAGGGQGVAALAAWAEEFAATRSPAWGTALAPAALALAEALAVAGDSHGGRSPDSHVEQVLKEVSRFSDAQANRCRVEVLAATEAPDRAAALTALAAAWEHDVAPRIAARFVRAVGDLVTERMGLPPREE